MKILTIVFANSIDLSTIDDVITKKIKKKMLFGNKIVQKLLFLILLANKQLFECWENIALTLLHRHNLNRKVA